MLEKSSQLLIGLERYNFCFFCHYNSSVILCNTKETLMSIGCQKKSISSGGVGTLSTLPIERTESSSRWLK
jgi:hypothetical protein